jgi:hypothetical protein
VPLADTLQSPGNSCAGHFRLEPYVTKSGPPLSGCNGRPWKRTRLRVRINVQVECVMNVVLSDQINQRGGTFCVRRRRLRPRADARGCTVGFRTTATADAWGCS